MGSFSDKVGYTNIFECPPSSQTNTLTGHAQPVVACVELSTLHCLESGLGTVRLDQLMASEQPNLYIRKRRRG